MKISNPFHSAIPVRGTTRSTPIAPQRSTSKTSGSAPAGPSASAQISSSAQLLARAATDLGGDLEIRDDAVQAARQTLRNWQGLTSAQVGQIADGLLSDLS